MHKSLLVILGLLGIVWISGCKTEADFRRERAEKAVRYFEVSKFREHELNKDTVLNLSECIQIGLNHNLDIKVFHQEEDIASEMRTAEILGMMPSITFREQFNGRSNTPASSSESYRGQGETYGASQSQDRYINTFNIDFALSLIDFGLAFFNSQQAQDRVIMRKLRTERMAQNLTTDIIHAYCRVAAAQRARALTENLLKSCKDYQNRIEKLAKEKQITPFRAFYETRRFLDMERRLTIYTLDYENSCVELRSLLGFYPSANIQVKDNFLDSLPDFTMPDIEVLEKSALINRPELRETEVQRHINLTECYKTIVTMFPNTRVFINFNTSNNSFLYNQNWWDMGIFAALNLLKLPQKIAQAISFSSQADADTMRTYAQSIAVISQVRLAHADIAASQKVYEQSKRTLKNYEDSLSAARANMGAATSDLSQLELNHMILVTTDAKIDCTLALTQYYISCYRLLNVIGSLNPQIKSLNNLAVELDKTEKTKNNTFKWFKQVSKSI